MKGSELKMKHTKEEILKALHVIQETCEEYDAENESNCPFYNGRFKQCHVMTTQPEQWKINDNAEVWRGLL